MNNIFEKLLISNNDYVKQNELFAEMATVTTSDKYQIKIAVNPDIKRKGVPYFKVYDSAKPKKNSTRIARLHFLDTGMEYHKGDGYLDWYITNQDIKDIKRLLLTLNVDFPNYNNWQVACYHWNLEYGLIPMGISKYINGIYDHIHHPSYIPSTTQIPDTWIYDYSKAKKKRSKFTNDIEV